MMQTATAAIRFVSLVIPALVICFNIFLPRSCADTFNLSFSLTEGGNRLELSQQTLSKGVKIAVNSDIATRYEVAQRIVQPLESRDVPGLAIRDNFVVRGIGGSNRFGSLRVMTGDTPVRPEDTIYVSDNAGDPDSFTLVYTLSRPQDITPGDYYGRIGYTLNPIGSNKQSITQILEVYVSISKDSAGIKPQIEITTPDGSKQITLNSRRLDTRSAAAIIKINGKFDRPFAIKQYLVQAAEALDGRRLDYEAVNFFVGNAENGIAVAERTPLSSAPQEIYSSDPRRGIDNTLAVNYSLSDLAGQKAGKYRTRIQYLVNQMGAETRIDSLSLDIDIEPVFELIVAPQDQKYAVEFRDIKPSGPPKRNEITIEVKTNKGKRYQVVQDIHSQLRDKEGRVIPGKYFTFQTQGLGSKGQLNFSVKEEVKSGSKILFVSDESGSPAKFKVIYELGCKEDVRAGDYATNVTYSLLEI